MIINTSSLKIITIQETNFKILNVQGKKVKNGSLGDWGKMTLGYSAMLRAEM